MMIIMTMISRLKPSLFLTERILLGIPISGCAVGYAEKSLVDIASGDFLGLSRGNWGPMLKKRGERERGVDDVSVNVYSLHHNAVYTRGALKHKLQPCKNYTNKTHYKITVTCHVAPCSLVPTELHDITFQKTVIMTTPHCRFKNELCKIYTVYYVAEVWETRRGEHESHVEGAREKFVGKCL
jgi:hypothetical protein